MSDIGLLTVDSINALLRAVVIKSLNLSESHVIIETRNRPRPYDDGLYVTIFWVTQDLLVQGSGDFLYPDNGLSEGTQALRNDAFCTVRILTRGTNAYNAASLLRQAFDSADRQWDLYHVVGFAGIESIQDISVNFGGQIQQTAFFDFSFYVCFGAEYSIPWFTRTTMVINEEKRIFPKGERPC